MLSFSLVIAGGVSYFASSRPDGLERVAENLGFLVNARESSHTVLHGYAVPGLDGFFSNGLAGIIGVLVTFGLTIILTWLVKRKI